MAKQLIPEELDALIQEYLTDGVLTDKERKVILNKAVNMGLDYDEIDLYLDAQEQKVEQSIDAAARKQKGKVCPFCGKPVPQLAEKCPECGETLTAEASSELQEIFDNLEDALVDLKSGSDVHKSKATVERYVRKAKMYYGNNPKVQKLLNEIEVETINAEKKAKTLARNKTISSIFTYNKKLTAAVVVGLIIVAIWGINAIWSAIKGPDPTDLKDDAQATIEAVNKSIEEGDIDKAVSYCEAYAGEHGSYEMKSAFNAIALAYMKAGEYEKALEIDGRSNLAYASQASSTRYAIQDALIEAGEYDKAEKAIDYWGDTDEYFNYLCKCIDHMQENGNAGKVKSFIDRKVSSHYTSSLTHEEEWQAPVVKQRLYEYAGL